MLLECFLFGRPTNSILKGSKVLELRLLIQHDRRSTSKVSFPIQANVDNATSILLGRIGENLIL
jgi:hypothetical protein